MLKGRAADYFPESSSDLCDTPATKPGGLDANPRLLTYIDTSLHV